MQTRKRTSIGSIALVVTLSGCAVSSERYALPSTPLPPPATKELPLSFDSIWDRAVSAIGRRFFVINNLDRSSGFMNVSYSGEPGRYVDCGTITRQFGTAGGKQEEQSFNGAAARSTYPFTYQQGAFTFVGSVDRRMSLDGRINLVFQSVEPGKTRVSASTRYVLTRDFTATNQAGQTARKPSETISFNSGQQAAFPEANPLTCRPTGLLEAELFDSFAN